MVTTRKSTLDMETYYIDTNGVSLHVKMAGPADGQPVILLHGFPEFWYGWKAQIEFLANAGYRVIVPDQRGYNLSDKPKAVEAYRMYQLVADVIGLIDHIGHDQVYLVGHDWGGGVAWATAIQHPERIKKLVILNTPHPSVFLQQLGSNPRQVSRSLYMGFFQLPFAPEAMLMLGDGMGAANLLQFSSKPGTFSDADIAEYIKAWKRPGAMTAMLNWYRATGRKPSSGNLSSGGSIRVTMPTLLVWGTKDIALGSEMAQPSIDLCDDGRLITFNDAGHWIAHEKPNEVNALMAEFLQ